MLYQHIRISYKQRLFSTFLILLAAIPLLLGCGTTTPSKPASAKPTSPATTTITYDKDFVKNFLFDAPNVANPVRTPEGVAKRMKSWGKEYYTNVSSRPNGEISATINKVQRKNLIKDRNDTLREASYELTDHHPEYHADPNTKTRTVSVWTDKAAQTAVSMYLLITPDMYGELYYINGNTGPWDMTIKVYDCHNGQLVQQYMASQGDQFDPTKMPE